MHYGHFFPLFFFALLLFVSLSKHVFVFLNSFMVSKLLSFTKQ